MPIAIPEPCHEDWDAMARRGRGRYCQACDRTVLDLARMTRKEAARALREAGPDACANVAFDQHDDPIFRPEPARAPFFAGGLVLLAALTAGGCGGSGESPIEPIAAEHAPDGPDAPCAVEAPPMLPVEATPAVEPLATGPVAAPLEASDGVPTAAQLAQTQRKQEDAAVVTPRVVHHHRRGRIARVPRTAPPGTAPRLGL